MVKVNNKVIIFGHSLDCTLHWLGDMDGVSVLWRPFIVNLASFFCRNDNLHILAWPYKRREKTLSVSREGWISMLTPAGMQTLKWHSVTPLPCCAITHSKNSLKCHRDWDFFLNNLTFWLKSSQDTDNIKWRLWYSQRTKAWLLKTNTPLKLVWLCVVKKQVILWPNIPEAEDYKKRMGHYPKSKDSICSQQCLQK